MNSWPKTVLFVLTLALIASTGFLVGHLRKTQKLGQPGVLTAPSNDPRRLQVVLPEKVQVVLPDKVLNYSSEEVEVEKLVLDFLPQDTSFGQRRYTAPDGSWALINVVLMGSDRTSIHKPQFCLTGSGWDIDEEVSTEVTIPVYKPTPYALPATKLITTKHIMHEGRPVEARGIFVYWFVADGQYTARHGQRMWWMARDLLTTGVLQRWAYVTCFAACPPGYEEATFRRMQQFIAEAVPEFQLTPRPQQTMASKP